MSFVSQKSDLSDFDGISPSYNLCKYCRLNTHSSFLSDADQLCKVCQNLKLVVSIDRLAKNLAFPSLIFILIALFVDSLSSLILTILIIGIGP